MKSSLLKLIFAAACLCVGALATSAAPLRRSDVTANPAWLVHLDCDALRPTTIGQQVQSQMDQPEVKAKIAAFQTIFNLDLRTQLHGLTLYGDLQAPQEGMLIVYADFDSNRLMTLAKAAHDYRSTKHNRHIIGNWIDDNKKSHNGVGHRVYAAIVGKRVLFGQHEQSVAAALDVIDGKSPSLAGSTLFANLGASDSGHFIEAAARKMDLPNNANADILKLSKTGELVMGEQNQHFQATLTLVTDSEEVAGHLLSVAQGLVALMKLQTSEPEKVKFANGIVIQQNGASVVANINLPASDVVVMMKANAARKAAARRAKQREE